jgi:cytochrome c2
MDRYMIFFLIFCGWFVVFKMFPARFEQKGSFCGTVEPEYVRTTYEENLNPQTRRGKEAFMANCARCHSSDLEKHSTGPALLGVSNRIPAGDWIYRWVQNSSKLIQEGDAYANKIWVENRKAVMDPFPNLDKATIDDIMAWINGTVLY